MFKNSWSSSSYQKLMRWALLLPQWNLTFLYSVKLASMTPLTTGTFVYQVCLPFRADRSNRRGGGVCIYFSHDVSCKILSTIETCHRWIECILSHFSSFNIILFAVYVPPNLSASQLSLVIDYLVASFDEVSKGLRDCNLVILGDMNNLPTSQLEQVLGLLQVVREPTRGSPILDKVLIEPVLDDYFGTTIVGPNVGNPTTFLSFWNLSRYEFILQTSLRYMTTARATWTTSCQVWNTNAGKKYTLVQPPSTQNAACSTQK